MPGKHPAFAGISKPLLIERAVDPDDAGDLARVACLGERQDELLLRRKQKPRNAAWQQYSFPKREPWKGSPGYCQSIIARVLLLGVLRITNKSTCG